MKNMKIKKLIATALTVASIATMTAIPAFAADSTSASTSINLTTQASDVRVTVPTSYSIILNKDDNYSVAPTNFTVTNNSLFNLTIDSVKFDAKNSGWKIMNNQTEGQKKLDSKEVAFFVNTYGSLGDNPGGKTEEIQLKDKVVVKSKESSNLDIKVVHGPYSTSQKFDNAFTMTTKFKFQ